MEKDFEIYLKNMGKSHNTIAAYTKDVAIFEAEQKLKDTAELADTTETEVVSYVLKLKKNGLSSSTINRKLSALRTYFNYLMSCKRIIENPTKDIKAPKVEKKKIEYLSIEEIDKLLSTPDDSIKGIRDKAMLELLYATGIRVSELIETGLEEINLKMSLIMCSGHHSKARVVPIGRTAKKALERYIKEARPQFLGEKETEEFFINYNGEALTRQWVWKILKEYADKAELTVRITPQTLRNSFAVHMLNNGADLKALQELMGHEDISATEVYCEAVKTRIKDIYDRTHPRA